MIKIKTLDCGVRLATEKISHVQSVSLGIWTRVGSRDESTANAGISHLIEHMMFKGTEKRTAKQIAEDTDKIAGQMNAFTGKEATCYYMKTLSTNVEKAVDILLDMFLASKFDKEELKKEKSVIYEEMKMIEDSPDDYVHDLICEMVFNGNPLAKPIIGTPSSLKRISRNTIMQYIDEEYTRDSIIVAIAGNFDEEKIADMLEDKFSKLTARKEAKIYEEAPYVPLFRVKVKDTEQAHLCMGTRSIKASDDRYYALSVLNNILGSSMSSRLFQSIREEKGLAYSVYSMASAFSDMGYFNIYAGVSHDKLPEAIAAIKQELIKMGEKGVTDDELQAAKEQIKGSYIFSQENVSGRMFSIGKNLTILGRTYTLDEVIQRIDSVTQDDINGVIPMISDITKYSAAAVTNKKIALKKYMEL